MEIQASLTLLRHVYNHWWSQDFIVGEAKLRLIQPVRGGGGGMLSAVGRFNERGGEGGGGVAVCCWPIQLVCVAHC